MVHSVFILFFLKIAFMSVTKLTSSEINKQILNTQTQIEFGYGAFFSYSPIPYYIAKVGSENQNHLFMGALIQQSTSKIKILHYCELLDSNEKIIHTFKEQEKYSHMKQLIQRFMKVNGTSITLNIQPLPKLELSKQVMCLQRTIRYLIFLLMGQQINLNSQSNIREYLKMKLIQNIVTLQGQYIKQPKLQIILSLNQSYYKMLHQLNTPAIQIIMFRMSISSIQTHQFSSNLQIRAVATMQLKVGLNQSICLFILIGKLKSFKQPIINLTITLPMLVEMLLSQNMFTITKRQIQMFKLILIHFHLLCQLKHKQMMIKFNIRLKILKLIYFNGISLDLKKQVQQLNSNFIILKLIQHFYMTSANFISLQDRFLLIIWVEILKMIFLMEQNYRILLFIIDTQIHPLLLNVFHNAKLVLVQHCMIVHPVTKVAIEYQKTINVYARWDILNCIINAIIHQIMYLIYLPLNLIYQRQDMNRLHQILSVNLVISHMKISVLNGNEILYLHSPQPITDQFIGCIRCVSRSLNNFFYQGFSCSLSLILNGQSFISTKVPVIGYRYSMGELVVLNQAQICQMSSSKCERGIHSIEDNQGQECKNAAVYILNDGICQPIKTPSYSNIVCGQFCEICNSNDNRCYRCYDPSKYFISSDAVNCELCSIENCKYCTLEDTENSKFEIYSLNFEPTNRMKGSIRMVCARCEENYIFNYHTLTCEKASVMSNCELYYKDENQQSNCILSTSIEQSYTINKCQAIIAHCQVCTISQYTYETFCLQCEPYYYSLNTSSCITCRDNSQCFADDAERHDHWKTEVYPYYYNKFSITDEIINLEQTYSNRIDENTCEVFDAYGSKCSKCKSDDYGIKRNSLDDFGQCKICSYLCEACLDLLEEEWKVINPQFDQSYLDNSLLRTQTKCFQKTSDSENVYIDTNLRPLLCEDNKPCKVIGTQQITFSCIRLVILLSSRMSSFDKNININLLMERGVSLFRFEWTLNFASTCELPVVIKSTIQQQVVSLRETEIILKGDPKNSENIVTASLLIGQFTYICLRDLVIVDMKDGSLELNHTTYYTDIDLINDVFRDWSQNQPIITANVRKLNLLNNTFENVKFVGQSIFQINQIMQQINLIKIEDLIFQNCEFTNTYFLIIKEKDIDEQFQLKINKLKFINCIFRNFTFLHLIMPTGDFQIDEVTFQNITTNKFSFINATLRNLATIRNLQIFNSNFQQSNLIHSNLIQFKQVILSNNTFTESQFISMSNQSYSNLIFDQLFFNEINIEGTLPFLDLINLNYQITIQNMKIQGLICQNQQFNYYPTFQLSAKLLEINNINITLPKQSQKLLFNIYETKQLLLYDIEIQNQNQIDKVLTTTYECFQENDSQGIFNLVDNIIISISQIYIQNLLAVNNAVFTIIFSDNYKTQTQIVEIIDIQVQNVVLVKNQQNIQISLFYIGSAQDLQFSMKNANFSNVWMHNYYSDNAISSTILTINAPKSTIILNELIMNDILSTNTTHSILQLNSKTIDINNITASEINSLNFQHLKKFLTINFKYTSDVYMEYFNELFYIDSQGGLGNLQAEQIQIKKSQIYNSKGHSGGLFYITTKSNGIIQITNCVFHNIQGNLLSQSSRGGLLYIDSSSSLLTLSLSNITTTNTFSCQFGGLLFLIPSIETTNIFIQNASVSHTYSSQGSLLYAEFQYKSKGQITINNLNILDQNMDNFLKQLQVQSEKDFKILIESNYLFDIQHCTTFILTKSQFRNLQIVNFIKLQNSAYLTIQNVYLDNINFIKQSFLQFLNPQIKKSSILIDNFIIQNSYQYSYKQSNYLIENFECQQFIPLDLPQQCSIDSISPSFINYFSQIHNSEIYNCNINTIISIITQQTLSPLININTLQNQIYFRGTNIVAKNISITNYKGFFVFEVSDNQDNIIKFFDSNFHNIDCGQYGCLSLINSDLSDNIESIIQNIDQIRSDSNQSQIRRLSDQLNYFQIYNAEFYKNKANYGAGLLAINLNINISNCQFINNSATQAGGALYFQYKNTNSILNDLQLVSNLAKLGGDLFIKGNTKQVDLTSVQGLGIDNNNSVSSKPVQLSLKARNNIISNIINIKQGEAIQDQVIVNPYLILGSNESQHHLMYPSGQSISTYTYFDTQSQTYIPYNLSLQILAFNEKFEQVVNLDGSSCNLYQKQSNGQGEFQPLPNQETVYYDTQTNSYNLDNYTFIFDPIIENDLHLIIKVKCDSILYDNYELLFTVQTFQCQMGEYYFQSQCLVCDPEQSYYSLDPSKGKCDIKNDQTTLNITSAMVQLKENYWRPMVQSSQIVYCLNNPSNCLGGWNVGDMSCKPGFIGALCEECDSWNLNGYGRFGKTIDYNCDVCDNFHYIYLKTLFLVFWIYLSVFITCQSVNNSNINIKKQQVLNPAFYKLLHSLSVDKTGIILKMLTNFVQIISAIQSFQITLNLNLDFAFGMVGNPVKQITTLLDCLISQYIDFDIVYYKMILMACLVLFLIQFGIIAYILIICSKKSTYNSSNLWVLLIFIYLFTQSGLVFDLSSLLGYREIANIKWVKGAVYLEYDTINHLLWILRVVVPIAGFFQLLIPGIMFYELYRNRKRLFEINFRKRFSYLINEYKESAWFWEIIKLFQRTYIIANLNLYSDETLIKSTQIFLAIFIYFMLLYFLQPYSQKPLIQLEIKSTFVQLCSIILAATIYQTQISGNSIYYFYILILIIIVGAQLTIFIFEISKGYFEKLKIMIENLINEKIQNGQMNLPSYLIEYFKQKQLSRLKLQMRFRKLKFYLRQQTKAITVVKKIQSIYPQIGQKSEYILPDVLISPKTEKLEMLFSET